MNYFISAVLVMVSLLCVYGMKKSFEYNGDDLNGVSGYVLSSFGAGIFMVMSIIFAFS